MFVEVGGAFFEVGPYFQFRILHGSPLKIENLRRVD
jgi:hypothetical protein